ncbi:MAG: hypothetical protein RSF68_11420 [Myroides sp.]
MKFFSLLLFLITPLTYSQTIDLNNWIENKKSIDRYKHPQNEVSYIIIEDSINYRIAKQTSPTIIGDSIPFSDEFIESKIGKNYGGRIVKKVFNGYFLSYLNGEHGSDFYFISNDGKKSYEIESIRHAKYFFELDGELFVSCGLSHLALSRGSIYKLKFKRKWKATYVENLEAAPEILFKHLQNTYIITHEKMLTINQDTSLNTILTFPFNIGIFYPTSSVIIKNDLYIVMRSGVLKVKNFSYKPTFHWLEEKNTH